MTIDDQDSSTSTLRLLLQQALGNWDTKALLGIALDEDAMVRTAVARELHTRGTRDVFVFALNHMSDEADTTREIAVFLLGQLGTPSYPYRTESLRPLTERLADSSSDVRSAAAAALGHLCHDEMPSDVETALLDLAGDAEPTVRSCVAYALGNSSGDDAVRRKLEQLLNDEHEEVRSYAQLGFDLLDENR